MKNGAPLWVLSVLISGAQSVWSCERYADSAAQPVFTSVEIVKSSPFPADADAPNAHPPVDAGAERRSHLNEIPAIWGIGRRERQDDHPFHANAGVIETD